MEQPAVHPVAPSHRRPHGRRRLVRACLAVAVMGSLVASVGAPARAASGSYLQGIDLSHYNGAVDWRAVKDAGIKFAIVKATESTSYGYTQYYRDNRPAAAKAHVTFGAYHFARPSGSTVDQIKADGKAEADYFIDVASPRPGDLLPALDLEDRHDGLTVAHRQAWVWAFLNQVVARIHEKPI